jgi:hypothetical protein
VSNLRRMARIDRAEFQRPILQLERDVVATAHLRVLLAAAEANVAVHHQELQDVNNDVSTRWPWVWRYMKYVRLTSLAVILSACGGNPVAPLPQCAYDHTGDLVLVNLSDAGTPRDVYVDGHLVTTIPYGGQIVVAAAAGVVHTVEWVSTITGGTRDVTRVLVDECTPTTLTNHF